MGWLSDRIIKHLYVNDSGEELILELPASEDHPAEYEGYKFKETLPFKDLFMTKVQFERNGRVGYKIDVGNGSKPIVRSATRERYEHMVGNTGVDALKKAKAEGKPINLNESVFTKSFSNHVKEEKKKQIEKHNHNLKKIIGGKK